MKNIEMLLNDNLPGLKIRIATEPFIEFSTSSTLRVKREEISATLLGLLKSGKQNCCQEPKQQAIMQNMFKDEDTTVKIEPQKPIQPEKPVEPQKPVEDKTQQKDGIKKPKPPKKPNPITTFFKDWTKTLKDSAKDFVDNATQEEGEYIADDEENN